jgi:hypothetical protein
MKIKAQDLDYGAVLHQIVMHPVFTSINKPSDKAGLYRVNDTTDLLIKCAGGVGPEWTFAFTPDDLGVALQIDCQVALKCGNETVCLLGNVEMCTIVDAGAVSTQYVKVRFSNGESMRVSGSAGSLGRTVAHNAFPVALLGPVGRRLEEFSWPELCQLNFYSDAPQPRLSTTDRTFDLADNLTGTMSGGVRTVYMGVSSISQNWPEWSEARLRVVEDQIKYDLKFDGYGVKVQRHTPAVDPRTRKKDRPCSDEFVWKLTIMA